MGDGSGSPSPCCCGDSQYPRGRDACMCGCGFLNGVAAIIVAQFLLFVGAWFSFAALGDCAFAEITETSVIQDLVVTRVGFFTFEKPNGSCYHYDQFTGVISEEDQIQLYTDFLGATWQRAGILASAAAIFGWIFFFYSTSYCCSAQIRAVRYMTGFIMSIVMVVVQGCTFIVFGSNFCDENGCAFSRSAGFAVGAILCYLFAGIAFLATSDYPGESDTGAPVTHSEPKAVPQGAAVPTEKEEVDLEAVAPPSMPKEAEGSPLPEDVAQPF